VADDPIRFCDCPMCLAQEREDRSRTSYRDRLSEMRRDAEARVREERRAQRRALLLLREHLTPAQQADVEATGRFNVRASNRRLYRIDTTRSVESVGDQRGNARTMSFYISADLPTADLALALKILFSTEQGPLTFEAGGVWAPGGPGWRVPPACSSGPLPGIVAPDDAKVARFYKRQGEPELAIVTNPYPDPYQRDRDERARFLSRVAVLRDRIAMLGVEARVDGDSVLVAPYGPQPVTLNVEGQCYTIVPGEAHRFYCQ